MTMLEKSVEALRRCIPADTFNAAMAEVEREEAAIKSVNTEPVGTKPADVEDVILAMLAELGIPAHIKGYRYAVTGLTVLVDNPNLIDAVTKELYPFIAKQHNTTSSRVERAIRHAIEVAWSRGDMDVLTRYFGYTVSLTKGKPTNSEFLAQLATLIRQKMKKEG